MKDAVVYTAEQLATVVASFMDWIECKIIEGDFDGILFVSREGDFFKRCYEISNHSRPFLIRHLEVSRRSLSVPLIFDSDDIEDLIRNRPTRSFKLSGLLKERFGVLDFSGTDIDFRTLNKGQVLPIVMKYKNEILYNAKKERENLMAYFGGLSQYIEGKKIAVVDIGYNGTTQEKLEKIFDKTIFHGLYLSTFIGVKSTLKKSNYHSFLFHDLDNIKVRNFFTKNIALVESIFSVGASSVEKYDHNGIPIYKKNYFHNVYIEEIQEEIFFRVGLKSGVYFSRNEALIALKRVVATPTYNSAKLFLNSYIEDDFGIGKDRYILYDPGSPDFILRSEWKEGAYAIKKNKFLKVLDNGFFRTVRQLLFKKERYYN